MRTDWVRSGMNGSLIMYSLVLKCNYIGTTAGTAAGIQYKLDKGINFCFKLRQDFFLLKLPVC